MVTLLEAYYVLLMWENHMLLLIWAWPSIGQCHYLGNVFSQLKRVLGQSLSLSLSPFQINKCLSIYEQSYINWLITFFMSIANKHVSGMSPGFAIAVTADTTPR